MGKGTRKMERTNVKDVFLGGRRNACVLLVTLSMVLRRRRSAGRRIEPARTNSCGDRPREPARTNCRADWLPERAGPGEWLRRQPAQVERACKALARIVSLVGEFRY